MWLLVEFCWPDPGGCRNPILPQNLDFGGKPTLDSPFNSHRSHEIELSLGAVFSSVVSYDADLTVGASKAVTSFSSVPPEVLDLFLIRNSSLLLLFRGTGTWLLLGHGDRFSFLHGIKVESKVIHVEVKLEVEPLGHQVLGEVYALEHNCYFFSHFITFYHNGNV